jgi:uncharacterized membrane protein YbhN (UPF0104 family)
VGVIVGLAIHFARGLDGRAIVSALAGASVPLLVLSALGNAPLVWTKARRMRALLDGQISTPRLMALYFTSYAADNLLMSQAGLGIRVAWLRVAGVPLATAASAQAVEKILEALGLVLLAGPFLWLSDGLGHLRRVVLWVTLAAVASLVIAVVALPRHRALKDLGSALRRSALTLTLLTAAAWVLEALMVIAVLAAMHLDLPWLPSSALVLLAVNLAALIPGLPGNLGTFEVSCSLALGAVGLDPTRALSFALVYHALHTVPVTVAGVILQRWLPHATLGGTSNSTTTGR